MLYKRRSGKSVAGSRLNVIGVRAFFFLPGMRAALTSADEFHSVWKTGCPAALSHFASNASCVVFPDPSMPSTTKSFPGFSWGVVRLFSMRCAFLLVAPARHFEAQRPVQHVFQRLAVAVRGPQFQLGVARRLQPDHVLVPLRHDVERGDD